MKIYLISDNIDTLVGLKIAGIDGEIAHTKEEINKCLDNIKENREIGIIVVTEKVATMVPERITSLKLSKYLPLLVEIPDRHGSIKGEDWILRYIKEAIGLKI